MPDRPGGGPCTLLSVASAALALATGVVVVAAVLWGVETGADVRPLPGSVPDRRWVVLPGAVAAGLAAVVGWWAGSVLARRVRRLAAVVRSMAAGDRQVRVGPLGAVAEVAELGAVVDAMADALDREEQARRRVVRDIAHEIRTPLAALQAGLEELRDGLIEPDVVHLSALHEQTLLLGRLLDDLRTLPTAEAGSSPPNRTVVDLALVARRELRHQWPVLGSARVRTLCGLESAPVVGDDDRLHQVVGNLVDNVIRYAGPGCTMTVTTGTRDGVAFLRVEDDGPGIHAKDLPHVTERLYRGRAAEGVCGSGIGLAVVRELVEAHGGRLVVGSPSSERGTRVDVLLPAADTPVGPSAGEGSCEQPCACTPFVNAAVEG